VTYILVEGRARADYAALKYLRSNGIKKSGASNEAPEAQSGDDATVAARLVGVSGNGPVGFKVPIALDRKA
jgi:hypothetical protein